jgi:hypothetical protein
VPALAFAQNARLMETALVDGTVGVIMARGRRLLRVARFAMKGGKIVAVDVIVQPARLRELGLAILTD